MACPVLNMVNECQSTTSQVCIFESSVSETADCPEHFPSNTQAPKGPGLCSMKRAATREQLPPPILRLPSLSQQQLGFQGYLTNKRVCAFTS